MESRTTERFRKSFNGLPKRIQEKAKAVYKIWNANPFHPSLHFKQIHEIEPIFSVRIGLHHRALGVKESNTLIWFWIGTHEDYNTLISKI